MQRHSKPKLLVTTSTFVRNSDDPQPRFVLNLVKGLSAYFNVVVLAPSHAGLPPVEQVEGIRVVRFRYAPLKSLETLAYSGGIMSQLKRQPFKWLLVPLFFWGQRRALRQLLRGEDFDAINAHWAIPQGLIATSLRTTNRPPVIATCHGGDVYPFHGSPLKPLLNAALRRSTKVVPVSRELTVLCQGLLGSSAPKDKVSTVPMGVSLPSYENARAAPEIASLKAEGVFTAMFVGRLVEKKGVKSLLDALKLLRSDDNTRHPLKLAIVGDGVDREFLESYAADGDLGDSVKFLGWRSHTDLPHLLAAADVCVVPSVHADTNDKDGLPVVLLEAAASETTIIASEIAGIPDFISHRKNGLLFPPGDVKALADHLRLVITDRALARKLAQQAREDVKAFEWQVIAEKYADIIQQAIKAPS